MTRVMTVAYAPGDHRKPKPMIRISNHFLFDSGFFIGEPIVVVYENGVITIKKINKSL